MSPEKKRIVWVSFLILDADLHKISRLEILRSLAKKGHITELAAVYSRNKVMLQSENFPASVIAIPLRYVPVISSILFSVILLFLLPFYIIVYKPDFVITEPDLQVISFIPAIPIFRLKKIKLILDIRSTPVETYGIRGWLKSFFFNVSVLLAKTFFDGMTIITPYMKDEVCKRFNLNPEFVGVWSSGVSLELFNPSKYIFEGEKLRRKFKLSNRFVIFYHGALSKKRGLVETLEALTFLKSQYPNIVLFLIGAGSITKTLRELIKVKGLQNNVIIHEPVKYIDVPKYIAMSDVCIVPLLNHPYWRFQCPLNLLEYLAMEKVVILTDIPANNHIVGKKQCGIYISEATPIEIAKGIEYAYHNKSKLSIWGKTGRSIIEKYYSWDIVASHLEKYLLQSKYHQNISYKS
ncbi:MAG: glycosyltransferase family 4 protein [Fervidobacterium sp.]